MPRLSADESQRRRQRIIDAALRCFARSGIHQTSMNDIYREADVSAGSVYSWFSSKDDIIEAAYVSSGNRHTERMASRVADDPVGGLTRILVDAATMFDDPAWRDRNRVNMQLWAEALTNERVAKAALSDFDGFRSVFADAIKDGQRMGQIDPNLDPEATASVIWGIYLGLEAQKTWNPRLDHHAYINAATHLLNQGLTAFG